MPPPCALCVAVADATGKSGPAKPYNTVLHESPRFLVLPCIGPLTPGHVMVVSREHHPSLVAMGPEAVDEYEALADQLIRPPLFDRATVLEAEHGSTEAERAGACIVHTHVHWVPNAGPLAESAGTVLVARARVTGWEELAGVGSYADAPYLLLRGGKRAANLYETQDLPSQTIRRLLASYFGCPDEWHYVLHPRPDNIEATLAMWKRA